MTYLEKLGFEIFEISSSKYHYRWKEVYDIKHKVIKENKFGNVSIRNIVGYDRHQKNNFSLYYGFDFFDDIEFTQQLFINIGIKEHITGNKIKEPKLHIHKDLLPQMGFKLIDLDVWVRGIYLISLQPPKWDDDRGKVVIMRSEDYTKSDTNAYPKVVYKGRYFFDNLDFTKLLFHKIGVVDFIKNIEIKDSNYTFKRQKSKNEIYQFKDKELLNF